MLTGEPHPIYSEGVSGEVSGATSATQLPDVRCSLLMVKAAADNAGKVYLGFTAGVTKADGTTDATTGWPLAAGEVTPWLFLPNLNKLYRITDNAGDDLIYFAFR